MLAKTKTILKYNEKSEDFILLDQIEEALKYFIEVNNFTEMPMIIEKDFTPDNFFLAFTTEKLLYNAINQNKYEDHFIHIDSTYKLTLAGFPLSIIGTSDRHRQFRLIAALSKRENEETYERFLDVVYRKIQILNNDVKLFPKFVISDGADAIRNACFNLFGSQYTHIYCGFHLKQNLKSNIKKLVKKENYDSIIQIVDYMINSYSKQGFEFAKKQLKYQFPNETCFLKYFDEEYFTNWKCNWQRFKALQGIPLTNNPLESFNGRIKSEYTNFIKLNLKEFLFKLVKLIVDHSKENTNEFRPFPKDFCFELYFSKGELLSKLDVFLQYKKIYYTKVEVVEKKYVWTTPSLTEIKIMEDFKDKDIYKYLNDIRSLIRIDLESGYCSCIENKRKAICHHIISLHLKFNLKSYNILLPNKKRGRPGRVGKALVRDKIEAEKSEDSNGSIEDIAKELGILKKMLKFK